MQHNTFKGVACVMLSIFIWSGWMVASRLAVKGTLTPYDVTAIRFTIAGLILCPTLFKKGLRVGPWGIKSSLLLAFLIGAPYTIFATMGMKYAPASHASTVINGTLLVLTTIVGITVLKEPTSPIRLFGVACSVVGILCMLFAKSAYATGNQFLGHSLFVISGLMWGGYTLLARAWHVDARHAASIVCVFSLVLYVPVYVLFIPSHIGLENWREVAFQCVYQGLLTGVVAFVSYNIGIHILGASRTGTFIPLVPVLSTLMAIPVLGEIPCALEWAGVAAVSVGVLFASGALNWRPKFIREQPEFVP